MIHGKAKRQVTLIALKSSNKDEIECAGDKMKKLFASFLICTIAVNSLAALAMLNTSEAEIAAKAVSKAHVGIFYYAWYGYDNLANDWIAPKFVDYPISDLGNYSSSNKTVIQKQLVLMEDVGIDFVVISWWGFYDPYGIFVEKAAEQVFETAQDIKSALKFAIMVEPFNVTLPYDYNEIYNHVYETFAEPYSDLYFNFDGKPLICFFNDENLTLNGDFPQDETSRFNIVSVGQQPYTQWLYTNLNNFDPPLHEPRGQISVTPRFDDSKNNTRQEACIVDQNLTAGVYDEQWRNATKLAKKGKIDIIMISSWNEYVERTQIEPHIDGTSDKPPDFLYNKTRDYIKQINCEKNVQIHAEDYNALTLNHLSNLGGSPG